MKKIYGKIIISVLLLGMIILPLLGCESKENQATEIQVFIAASLNEAMTEIAANYNAEHPEVKIIYNADGSGKLMTQIEEGYACDIFFSAAQKQMNRLEKDDFVIEGMREDVVNNQLVVISKKDNKTRVTGLKDIKLAESIAIAGGSVPAGKYTREALVNIGALPATDDVSELTTREISDALDGVEISEQDNVSKVITAVIEGACEVGTVYLSDTYGHENELDILEIVSYDLTGNIIYPVARINNTEAGEAEQKASDDFYEYIISNDAKKIFEKYYFDTNI